MKKTLFTAAALSLVIVFALTIGCSKESGEKVSQFEESVSSPATQSPSAPATAAKKSAEPAAVTASTAGSININTASSAQLQTLKRIGPAAAAAIITYRNEHGAFKSVDDITKVPRIGPATLAGFRDQITVGDGVTVSDEVAAAAVETTEAAAAVSGAKININTASSAQLQTLPRIGPASAGNIIKYREENGPFKSIDEITNVTRIGDATLAGFRDMITVD